MILTGQHNRGMKNPQAKSKFSRIQLHRCISSTLTSLFMYTPGPTTDSPRPSPTLNANAAPALCLSLRPPSVACCPRPIAKHTCTKWKMQASVACRRPRRRQATGDRRPATGDRRPAPEAGDRGRGRRLGRWPQAPVVRGRQAAEGDIGR